MITMKNMTDDMVELIDLAVLGDQDLLVKFLSAIKCRYHDTPIEMIITEIEDCNVCDKFQNFQIVK